MSKEINKTRQFYLCLVAIFLGVLGTVVAKILILSINFFTHFFYFQEFSTAPIDPALHHLGMISIIVPIMGGLIVGIMARWGSPAIRGHGIPEVMEKILMNESKIQKRIAILKPLSSAIVIGSGGPFGAEGPIIATGGALGSQIGHFFNGYERKILLACGAAAGMTAIFGTPLSAVCLAIELLLFEFRPKSFIPVALSVVTAGNLHNIFFEQGPFITMPEIFPPSASALGIYLASGIFFGLVSVVVIKSIYFIEDLFEKIPCHWMWWPAIGGLAVGFIGLMEPKTLGVGYFNIQDAISGSILWKAAFTLMLLKFFSWSIALGSGTSGGTLAPLLTMGSLLGLILGIFLKRFIPGANIDIHVMSLIGMAALFAGCSRALLASVIFALEATGNPLGLIPLLGTCSVAYMVSHWMMETSIMTEKISRRGIKVPNEYFPQ